MFERRLRLSNWMHIALLIVAILALLSVFRALHPSNSEPPPTGQIMKVPPYNQGDYTTTVAVINGLKKSVKTSGCGAACVASVGQYMTGDKSYDPQSLFEWAHENGYYHGDGLGHDALSAMAKLFKLRSKWTDSEETVLKSLRAMRPVVAHMAHGTFSTGTGHYIILTGVTDDGLIVVHDPGSRKRSGKAYDLDLIIKESKGNQPFMIVGA